MIERRIKIVDLVYHCHHEYNDPQQLLEKHRPVLGFINYIKDKVDYTVVRHLDYTGDSERDGVQYRYFRRGNAPWKIPLATHRYIKSVQPDIVLVHGFVFPLQVMALKQMLGKTASIILQHHAEYPLRSIRRMFQRMADNSIDGYMFTSAAIAEPWVSQQVIKDPRKIIPLQAASVTIEPRDRDCCKKKLGITGNQNFLWVGRLNNNKDPFTVLKAFTDYGRTNPAAMLYMIYQAEDLLPLIKKEISAQSVLQKQVVLVGSIASGEMTNWYHAIDFFISSSHAEAAGYALLEAISVGCIPIVTRIPSYNTILQNGKIGYMFEPGDSAQLSAILHALSQIDQPAVSAATKKYFEEQLSFEKVAEGMMNMFTRLYAEKG